METLRLTVRADGGPEIGYGHLMRTQSIMDALRKMVEVEARYLVRATCDTAPLLDAGLEWEVVEGESWIEKLDPEHGPLLLDSYETTVPQLEALRAAGVLVVMLEDGKRLDRYPVDLLIDSAPNASKLPYRGEVATLFALGVEYLPLREDFLRVERPDRSARKPRNLLLTFGGSDPEDLTARLLPMIERVEGIERITVVLGPGYRGRVGAADAGGRIVILRKVNHMAELMQQADLAVSASGGTALELAYMGLPTLLVPLTEDQKPIAAALIEAGAADLLERNDATGGNRTAEQVTELLEDEAKRLAMSRAGAALVDGKGAARIARLILDQWRRSL